MMMQSKGFWLAQRMITLAFHVLGIVVLFTAGISHPIAIIWLVVVATHVLEIFVARAALKDLNIGGTNIVINTMLYGFTWWLPKKNGID